jgi:hypothetical protein
MSNFREFNNLQNLSNEQSKVYNLDTNHPLIPNSQEYIYYKKYISIHSEDRDYIKYPNSNEFEIELPEDILNIDTVRLYNWTFPANYNAFSNTLTNNSMTFRITEPFNPGQPTNNDVAPYSSPLYDEIYRCLFLSQSEEYDITIETGFYNPNQIVIELTNKFNEIVTYRIINYFNNTLDPNYNSTWPQLLNEFVNMGGYTNFIIVYNAVAQKIWFGNKCDGFTLTNSTQVRKSSILNNLYCDTRAQLSDYANWGLPGNLGLTRCDSTSFNINTLSIYEKTKLGISFRSNYLPRFYYGDVTPGDDGFWLLPNQNLPGSIVNWVECPFKVNLMGPAYFYMEIEGLNCIDETKPFSLNYSAIHTNQTNSVVNSSFAKIAIPTTPLSQWFDRDSVPYKQFVPPAERIRRLKIRLRYHNGLKVDFQNFNYSFELEFNVLVPQQLRAMKVQKF